MLVWVSEGAEGAEGAFWFGRTHRDSLFPASTTSVIVEASEGFFAIGQDWRISWVFGIFAIELSILQVAFLSQVAIMVIWSHNETLKTLWLGGEKQPMRSN